MEMDEDGKAVARSLAGDGEAFAALVRRHARAVHAYLQRRIGREAADELSSEVWLRAFRSRHTFDQGSSDARPWLYGIARNVLREALRRRRAAPIGDPRDETDPWEQIENRLEAQQRSAGLIAALEGLDPTDREVLLLVKWEELTPTQAATVLGIPAGTARWRLHRARLGLQASIGSQEREGDTHSDVSTVKEV